MPYLRVIVPSPPTLAFFLTFLLGIQTSCASQSLSAPIHEGTPAFQTPVRPRALWHPPRATAASWPLKFQSSKVGRKETPFSNADQGRRDTENGPGVLFIGLNSPEESDSSLEQEGIANTPDSVTPFPFLTDEWRVRIGTSIGLALDHLRWTIASPTGTPNILSELTFRDIYSVVGRLDLQVAKAPWSLDAQMGYGLIFEGNVRDDDFAFDDRTGLFSRSENDGTDHDLQSAVLLFGYDVHRLHNAKLRIVVGGRAYRQRFRITNGNQIFPPSGSFPNLNSTYTATWFGPVIGAGVDAAIPWTSFFAHGHMTFNPAWYWAEANWNLRSDFQQDPSFTHRAFGYGVTTLLKISRRLGPVDVHGGGRFLFYYADGGKDTTFFSNGKVVYHIPINEVISYSLALFLGASYAW